MEPINSHPYSVLIDKNFHFIISIQRFDPIQRIPINNMSYMKKLNREWLPVGTFIQMYSKQAQQMLSAYRPGVEIEDLGA